MNFNDLSEMRLRKASEASANRTQMDPDAESVESFLARGGVIQELPPCTFKQRAENMSQKKENEASWAVRMGR